MIVYATDLDRTLIFSHRFIKENPYKKETVLVEKKEDKEISYMAKVAYDKLQEIQTHKDIVFIPVTTRSLDEYKRVKLGFTPKYAIVANGGMILKDGEPIKEYRDYVKMYINPLSMASLSLELEDFESTIKRPRLVDGCYLFIKTNNEDLYDYEVADLIEVYKDWDFVRQRNKCYAVPKHISKQVALRWIWNELKEPFIMASGDSIMDLPMLTLADMAFIPSHSTLLSDGIVQSGRIVSGGLESPYQTMTYVVGMESSKK